LRDQVAARLKPLFSRCEPAELLMTLIDLLKAELVRKNSWTLAELAGHATPDRFQHLLNRAKWDHDQARHQLIPFVVEHLGDDDVVLVVDETGDIKKGTMTVGVQRQYTGTAGRIENAQVAVYLTYATPDAHALIDTRLYLPKSWTGDKHRMATARVPTATRFATKPALAAQMITAALDHGVTASWVAGDEVYGAHPGLRQTLHQRKIGYVLAVACNRLVTCHTGHHQAHTVARQCIDDNALTIISAGCGSKGQRYYQWAQVSIDNPNHGVDGGEHHLLIRRNPTTGELAYYLCYSPSPVGLERLVAIAGRRWRVEESFQASKQLAGLDQHQVRTWSSWQRWICAVMWSYALLVASTLAARQSEEPPAGLVPLSVNEQRHLLHIAQHAPHLLEHAWASACWRRESQYRARQSHFKRQAADLRL